jgi:hypothetical protein
MRPPRALVICLVIVFLGGALLATRPFWLKTYRAFTADANRATTWFWGAGKLIDGWLTFLVLALTRAVFRFLPLKPAREPFAIYR